VVASAATLLLAAASTQAPLHVAVALSAVDSLAVAILAATALMDAAVPALEVSNSIKFQLVSRPLGWFRRR